MSADLLLDNFHDLAGAPNGVGKLRDLILDLALRGKIVRQDPTDEPSSVLLKRILEARKVSEHLKKADYPEQFQEELIPYGIPASWTWTQLQIIGEINPRNHVPDDRMVSFVPMTLIPEYYRERVHFEQRKWGEIKKGYTHFAEGDVVAAKITPCFQNRKSVVMKDLLGGIGAGTTELHVFRPIPGTMCANYVLLFLRSGKFIESGATKMTGSAGQKRVPKAYFSKTPFPLPPLAEQHRIVARVDHLMALCDELETRQQKRHQVCIQVNETALNKLTTAGTPKAITESWHRINTHFDLLYDNAENLDELKRSILHLAVQGKLVPQDPNDEPASRLLEQIRTERDRLVNEKKLRPSKPCPPVLPDEMPFKLPKGWMWCRVEELARRIDYGTSEKSSISRTGIPVVRMGDIQKGEVSLENLKLVPKSIDDLPRLFLKHNDLLFNRTNSAELVGKTGLFRAEDDRYTFASYLIRLSFFQDYTSPEYMSMSMNAPYYRKSQIEPKLTQECGQANYNGTKLKESLIPLPPLREQYRIVAKADQLIGLCNDLQLRLHHIRSAVALLMDALVREAAA